MHNIIKNDRAIRMLYGEDSGIEELDCTTCVCIKCGRMWIEVLPARSLDVSKFRCLSVDQAKNLDLYNSITYKEHTLCDHCKRLRRLNDEDRMQILGFTFTVLAIIVLTILFAVGGRV